MIIEAGEPEAVCIPCPASPEKALEPCACGSRVYPRHAMPACARFHLRRPRTRGTCRDVSRRGGKTPATLPRHFSSKGK